ncbi:MAG: hypothetical protein DCC55_21590 [Chloroflexi bacterium]|nr:MAG: hypothetical protein DCC55_21590 [Chloroflexota bacterium]
MVNTTTTRLAQLWRNIVALPAQAEVQYSSTSSLNAQFWLGHFPWRPTAAWSVLAALLASGALAGWDALNWQTLALLLLLVDPLWGSIWRLAAGRKELLPLDAQALTYRFWLPYLQPQAPAQKVLGWDNTNVLPLLFRVALPSLTLASAVALVLGPFALALTGLVALISPLGWTMRRSLALQPVLLQSLVTVALPWLLTVQLVGGGLAEEWVTPVTLLALLATVHHWGEVRLLRNHSDWFGASLLALAEVGIVTLLVVAQAPFWLGLLVILWLPAWLVLFQRQSVQRVNFWWLAAFLVAALALNSR